MSEIRLQTVQSLCLNILEVETSKDNVNIFATNYQVDDLKLYQQDYSDFYFYRSGNQIYAWNLQQQPKKQLPTVFYPTQIDRINHTQIYNKILEQGIVHIFRKRNVRQLKYSSTWQLDLKDGITQFKSLCVKPVLEFALYPLYSLKSKKLIAGLSLRTSQKYSFTKIENEIQKENVDTRDWMRTPDNNIVGHRANALQYVKATNQYNEFKKLEDSRASDNYAYNEFAKYLQHFNQSIKNYIYLPDGLQITNFLFHHLENSHFSADSITSPAYYLYQDRTGKGFFNDRVSQLKPYNYDKFAQGTPIHILVLTPKIHEGTTETFLTRLKKSLTTVFHLRNIVFDTFAIDTNRQTIADVIDNQVNRSDYSLALVVVSESDKKIPIAKSPYYTSKARLLNQRIPTQKVLIETIKKQDFNDMLVNAIALNIFSKIGGVAWSVEKAQKQKVEVVIGISSTVDVFKNRLIGFANIFDYNGNYLIGDCSHLSTKETYLENLRDYLIKVIQEIIEDKQITQNDTIRLIFHLTKEAGKDTELKAIDAALKQFSAYKIQFGIVHLSFNHNLRIYAGRGEQEVNRGTFIQVSTLQALLHFGQKTKIPLLARLDQRSTFRDIYDISKQVLYFTHLCYRNFRPANVPVTIKYPSLMAKLTAELMQVDKWNEKQLNKIKDQLWFI